MGWSGPSLVGLFLKSIEHVVWGGGGDDNYFGAALVFCINQVKSAEDTFFCEKKKSIVYATKDSCLLSAKITGFITRQLDRHPARKSATGNWRKAQSRTSTTPAVAGSETSRKILSPHQRKQQQRNSWKKRDHFVLVDVRTTSRCSRRKNTADTDTTRMRLHHSIS